MTDFKSNAEIAQILTEVTGRKFETQHFTPEQFLADKSQAKEMKINSMVFFQSYVENSNNADIVLGSSSPTPRGRVPSLRGRGTTRSGLCMVVVSRPSGVSRVRSR